MKLPVNQLTHHPLNEEIYDISNLSELVDSIREVGLLQPLTVNQHNQVVSGNRRFSAVQELGWEEVECYLIEGLCVC